MNNQTLQQPLCKNFWRLVKPYWTSEEKWRAWLLLSGIIFCNLLQVRLMVIFNSWNKVFYDALQAFYMRGVLLALLLFVIILILAIFIFTYVNYLGDLLINDWRKWMTHRSVEKWLDQQRAYAMQILHKHIDNPDQRISEDLNELPALTLSLFSGLLNALLTLVSFSVILWQLSGSLRFHDMTIPGYMCWATLIYAAIGTAVMFWIGKNLPQLNYQQEQFNANFRFGLMRVRESAEQIALYRGEQAEVQRLKENFEPVFRNYREIITLQKYLGFFVNGYNLLVQVIGILIALPRYIAERLPMGTLLQIGNAFQQVVSALSFIVLSYSTIANWRAVIFRLTEFNRLMDEAALGMTQKNIAITTSESPQIAIKNLSLNLSSGELLTDKLEYSIQKGGHVLIMGKYGSGKSTLLRAIANIWPYGAGDIQLPRTKMLFLPQKPYFPLGTLRQALFYPEDSKTITDEKIAQILADCGLSYLQKYIYLPEVRYWSAEFSLGEQQLIALARIFIVEPAWVFLDESTSAMDEATEACMYQLLQTRFPAMTIVSVGHRSSVKPFHHTEMMIEKRDRIT